MTEKEIIEGNILIAQFMGKKIRYDNGMILFDDAPRYNSSWDWLMTVVEKINSDSNSVKIFNKGCQINAAYIDVRSEKELIMNVWLAVVKFIKYNYEKTNRRAAY